MSIKYDNLSVFAKWLSSISTIMTSGPHLHQSYKASGRKGVLVNTCVTQLCHQKLFTATLCRFEVTAHKSAYNLMFHTEAVGSGTLTPPPPTLPPGHNPPDNIPRPFYNVYQFEVLHLLQLNSLKIGIKITLSQCTWKQGFLNVCKRLTPRSRCMAFCVHLSKFMVKKLISRTGNA